MTSQVYYRKWRPSSFAELVGQEHVATTLRQALKQGRVSHSYLFCGPRGSGKTTTARIIAKAVNCLDLQDGDPCNTCTICSTINDGRFMDIIELDAASNRGIDEIRDIREKVNFAPAQGSRKVYIIDEAHMLTDAASNAFLKTLEEPPAHVIFVLCTTEVQKILPTIVSRCQRFDFRRIPSELIYNRLAGIAEAEGASVEPEALRLVARYASGSLRDAQNLLEQLVVAYGDGVGLLQVEDLLGLGHGDRWLDLVKYLLMGNTSASLEVINQAAWDGTDVRQLHRQTLELLRAVLLLHWGSGDTLDIADDVASQLVELVGQIPPWRIMKAVKTWGEVSMRYDAPSTLPLELAVVDICQDQATPSTGLVERTSPEAARTSPTPAPRPAKATPAAPPVQPRVRETKPEPTDAPQPDPVPHTEAVATAAEGTADQPAFTPSPTGSSGDLAEAWAATVKVLARHKGKKYNPGALLRDCRSDAISLDGDTLVLAFTHRTHMERMQEEMDDPQERKLVTETVSRFFERPLGLKLTLLEDNGTGGTSPRSAQNSSLVRVAMGMGARIIEEVVE
jgi:DNA polymerase-3 subunit gamma/tau